MFCTESHGSHPLVLVQNHTHDNMYMGVTEGWPDKTLTVERDIKSQLWKTPYILVHLGNYSIPKYYLIDVVI